MWASLKTLDCEEPVSKFSPVRLFLLFRDFVVWTVGFCSLPRLENVMGRLLPSGEPL